MMDLNQHIVNHDENPFHSHGLAKVNNSEQIGSTTSTSFNQRLEIENNRQIVGSYAKSTIGNSRSFIRPKAVLKPDISTSRSQLNIPKQRTNKINVAPRGFTEPAGRTYNPFA